MDQMMDASALEAILAATPYVAGSATEVGKTVAEGAGEGVGVLMVQEAYGKLKSLLRGKGGDGERAADAADELVADPDSEGRKVVLAEKLESAEADADLEIRNAARELLEAVKAQPGGEQHVQIAKGHGIAQAGPGGKAQVWINKSKNEEP